MTNIFATAQGTKSDGATPTGLGGVCISQANQNVSGKSLQLYWGNLAQGTPATPGPTGYTRPPVDRYRVTLAVVWDSFYPSYGTLLPAGNPIAASDWSANNKVDGSNMTTNTTRATGTTYVPGDNSIVNNAYNKTSNPNIPIGQTNAAPPNGSGNDLTVSIVSPGTGSGAKSTMQNFVGSSQYNVPNSQLGIEFGIWSTSNGRWFFGFTKVEAVGPGGWVVGTTTAYWTIYTGTLLVDGATSYCSTTTKPSGWGANSSDKLGYAAPWWPGSNNTSGAADADGDSGVPADPMTVVWRPRNPLYPTFRVDKPNPCYAAICYP
jgi:hypothetical protein